jgi:hypothetical protein
MFHQLTQDLPSWLPKEFLSSLDSASSCSASVGYAVPVGLGCITPQIPGLTTLPDYIHYRGRYWKKGRTSSASVSFSRDNSHGAEPNRQEGITGCEATICFSSCGTGVLPNLRRTIYLKGSSKTKGSLTHSFYSRQNPHSGDGVQRSTAHQGQSGREGSVDRESLGCRRSRRGSRRVDFPDRGGDRYVEESL